MLYSRTQAGIFTPVLNRGIFAKQGYFEEIPIVNGDFEASHTHPVVTGWVVNIGIATIHTWQNTTTYNNNTYMTPANNGNYVLDGGNQAVPDSNNGAGVVNQAQLDIYQDVDISTDQSGSIYKATADLLKADFFDDYSYITLEILNSSDTVLASATVDNAGEAIDTGANFETSELSYQPTQDRLRIHAGVIREAGNQANGAVDNVRLFKRLQ